MSKNYHQKSPSLNQLQTLQSQNYEKTQEQNPRSLNSNYNNLNPLGDHNKKNIQENQVPSPVIFNPENLNQQNEYIKQMQENYNPASLDFNPEVLKSKTVIPRRKNPENSINCIF